MVTQLAGQVKIFYMFSPIDLIFLNKNRNKKILQKCNISKKNNFKV